ncbi:MAG: asparagine synthase (glutamine-hydrolyzing) [Chromatiaceae bacterium]|nr:asparagine synthase (glutamine-hydrolyzing) [Chromatiaceae bacterium]
MCGIAGLYAYRPTASVDRDELRRIRDQMQARGPDGQGEWYSDDGRLALGHRRLSIIDLSPRGAQPMVSADGCLVVTFNGEIYNYRALRRDLEAKGRVFRSNSDTEVLLHLYADKGAAMVHDLRGMFAFALWDGARRNLFLARDPYGIKPLYWSDDGNTLRLASQVKALLAGGAIARDPDPAGIVGFYLFGSVPEPYTRYRAIHELPAGSYLLAGEQGVAAPVCYFSVAATFAAASNVPTANDPIALASGVRQALVDSVRHHLVADVPVGAFLSAGVDSSTLLALMAEPMTEPMPGTMPPADSAGLPADRPRLQTITLAFEEYRGTPDDESPLAEAIARRYGTAHITRVITEQSFQAHLPAVIDAMDQPSIDGINTWFVSQAAREQGLKVAISGLGGDELFGGYPAFRDIPRWVGRFALVGRIPGLGRALRHLFTALGPWLPALSPKAGGLIEYGGTYPGAYLLRRGLFMPWELPALIGADLAHEGLTRLLPLDHIQATLRPDPQTPFARVAAMESSLYMRNQLLRDADWAGMSHSLEIRLPLVDATLLRTLAGLLGTAARLNGKALLAASPTRPLPPAILARPKTGFTIPTGRWVERAERLGDWRRVPLLRRDGCHWSRRLAYVLGTTLG